MNPPPGGRDPIVVTDLAGTCLFAVAGAVAIASRHGWSDAVLVVVSLVLFAVGVGVALWAYAVAVERSRTDEIAVAGLYLLAGPVAPRSVKVRMNLAVVAQVIIALVVAIAGASGLRHGQKNVLAFAALVPMFGVGMNGLWAAKRGSFGARQVVERRRSGRKIG